MKGLNLKLRSLCLAGCLLFLPAVAAQSPAHQLLTPESIPGYKLRHQDKVSYRVLEDPIRSAEPRILMVNAVGSIWFPVSQGYEISLELPATNRTLVEIKNDLKNRLETEYYQKATIDVKLVDSSRKIGQATFNGEVKGMIDLPPGEQISLSSAVMRLGASEFANLGKVQVMRQNPLTGKITTIYVDVDSILKKGDRSKDLFLEDGDTVFIKAKIFSIQ